MVRSRNIDDIRSQFDRQGEVYKGLPGVSDEAGLRALVMLSSADKGSRVADFACGPGFLTMTFAECCAEAVGLDATEAFLEGARTEAAARRIHNVRFVAGDVVDAPFDDASFDVAVCRAAFHHFPDPEAVLHEMVRVTTPRGRIVVADMLTSDDAAKADVHNRLERLCDSTHVRALSEREFEAMFAANALEVAYTGRGRTSYELEQWIAHGGPAPEAADEIRRLMRACMEADLCGLDVRREGNEIHFSHTGAGFLLTKVR
jgi:ubiquinone/menaquinone biosynthesis C-methylase UbiE